jgi:hypothetical protein
MLKAHLDAVEQHLLQISRIPANAGHMLHRGTPREAFIREFLAGNLSAKLAVGTGEIIDATSLPRQPRNQFDIVIYKADYPRIDFGGGVNAFLAESVVATIEVKSLLTQSELEVAVQSASKVKKLQRHLITSIQSGYTPPGILSYVIAYDGPVNISTTYSWLKSVEAKWHLNQIPLPPSGDQRQRILSESVEGVFLLGKGSVVFDNSPVALVDDASRLALPTARYQVVQGASGNIFYLFLLLTAAASNAVGQWANLAPYVQNHPAPQGQFLP